jgi:membrane protein implicated in regulation of membrane protease activity
MPGWTVWLLLAFAFGAGELLTAGFFLAPFAVGGVAASLADAAGSSEPIAVVVFALVSILTLATVRPLLVGRITQAPALRTGAAALIGKGAVVLEPIVNHQGQGSVRIDGGEVWTARAYEDGREIPAGTHVEVVEIRGATALVI